MKKTSLRGADKIAGTALSRISQHGQPLALICGLPTSPTYFAADLCRDLLVRGYGSCEVVNLNDLGPATTERIASIAGPTLFLAEIPDAAVAAMAREADFPIVVLDQGFAAACRDFMAARDAKLLDAVRTMARGQMGVRALADIPRAALIAVAGNEPALVLAKLMARALGVSADACHEMVEARNAIARAGRKVRPFRSSARDADPGNMRNGNSRPAVGSQGVATIGPGNSCAVLAIRTVVSR